MVYSKTLGDHQKHLREVLKVLKVNHLFAKRSKCKFGCIRVYYLGHVITENEISVDPKKLQAIRDWPRQKTVKALRDFLGLTCHYRKFVRDYGGIASPLTEMLKKGAYRWTRESESAFKQLKSSLMSPPVLAMPNFEEDFIVECDASKGGIRAVLMQSGHPLAFISHTLKGWALSLSTYEKEMLAILLAGKKWRQYLLGRQFTIKIDQRSLKFLLNQKFRQESQHSWLIKLVGFDYNVEYKKGIENKVADALSRRDADVNDEECGEE